jgi:hypothetical protein
MKGKSKVEKAEAEAADAAGNAVKVGKMVGKRGLLLVGFALLFASKALRAASVRASRAGGKANDDGTEET